MLPADAPFVLLDDARVHGAGPARLYRAPVGTVVAWTCAEIAPALARLRAATRDGLHAAGFLAYEAGAAFEPRLAGLGADGTTPLLWFGLFDTVSLLDQAEVPALLPDPAGAFAGQPRPRIGRRDHEAQVRAALRLIAAGDIYQVNLSFPADVPLAGDPLALYARLRGAARAGWGGVLRTDAQWILSCSPELFFTLTAGELVARPMKGTAAPDADPAALRNDPKQRAENLMIVDLLRNDLARVAEPGSVAVPRLWEVEHYPTVQQLTSTVEARLAAGRDAIDVLAAAFPCGSITGAPKLRAQEIVSELEVGPRGLYTGSIGWLDPAGDAAFDVAIRTLVLDQGKSVARLGLGSGIVADSDPAGEWHECLAKGAFVTAGQPPFDLIETMRFDPHDGVWELERHLVRIKASADLFGFAFDRHDARNLLQAATFRLHGPARVRMRSSPAGALAIETGPIPATPDDATAAAVPLPVAPADFRLRHKTGDRSFYDAARAAGGAWEAVLVRGDGLVTEGSFTSLFVERDGRLLTPPARLGLLPGILRESLLAEGRAEEASLTVDDLSGGFLLGNALRGLFRVRLVAPAAQPRL